MDMKIEITDQHRWLEQFIGQWEPIQDADTPPEMQSDNWIETGRMLHGVWAVVEGSGRTHGTEANTILSLGYDAGKGKFVGTWIGTMMSHLFVYEGDLADDGRLVLDCLGPDFETPGKLRQYQDIYGFEGSDSRTLTAQTLQDDGTWQVFMTMKYRRVA